MFVRDHRGGGWITAAWTHQSMVGAPFADFTWRAARQLVAQHGGDDTDETAIARALDSLLTRASTGPGSGDARHRRVAARTRAAVRPVLDPPAAADEPADDAEDAGGDAPLAKVIPFGVFKAGDERRYR